ncbi:MAG: tRNA (N6-threonylcarbamoyladenosine(37)-N6)-methyltransferase TrmO [Clostridia bacterium]|nr:tRNA (N6-threonylcarbamoyladenosine(37)-N6)-methyltransferase TrmO [Clostridia bacterium]
MSDCFNIKKIAEIKNGFSDKFGIPRQSGLCETVKSQIIFEPEYRVNDAFKGIEGFSHIWIIWQFSRSVRDEWSPTVRPPRLGGNRRIGVFATRSPFRPNSLGLSCVKLDKVEYTEEFGPVLHISGADLMNKTPIFDIKPYIPYADSKPDATDGFLASAPRTFLSVNFDDCNINGVEPSVIDNFKEIIAEDPRPAYQNAPDRVYKMLFSGYEAEFTVENGTAFVKRIYKEKK